MLDSMAGQHAVDWSDMAVAWLLAHPAGILPVMGTNNLQRIGQIGRAVDVKLSRQDWYELYSAALGREVA
jgi:predicted oxidoreductase